MEIVERLSSLFHFLISAELHFRRRVGRFLINIAFTSTISQFVHNSSIYLALCFNYSRTRV